MKYLRVTGGPELSVAPKAFRTIAASPRVEEARLLDWNLTSGGVATLLFRIEGDRDAVRKGLDDAPEVVEVDLTPSEGGRFHALVRLDPGTAALLNEVLETVVREGLVVAKPVVYRDGEVYATLVGDSGVLQSVLDAFPPVVDVTVHEIGEYRGDPRSGRTRLSDRQREAVLAGLDLGYYEVPRRATHEDIAERIGCSPSTASEHLQKAETTLVRAAMDETEW